MQGRPVVFSRTNSAEFITPEENSQQAQGQQLVSERGHDQRDENMKTPVFLLFVLFYLLASCVIISQQAATGDKRKQEATEEELEALL